MCFLKLFLVSIGIYRFLHPCWDLKNPKAVKTLFLPSEALVLNGEVRFTQITDGEELSTKSFDTDNKKKELAAQHYRKPREDLTQLLPISRNLPSPLSGPLSF